MMSISFAVAVIVARYLGPEKFGIWSFALSLVGLFAIAGHLGLSGLAVRELVKDEGAVAETLGTVFILKLSGMLFGLALLCAYTFQYEAWGSLEFWILLIVGSSLIMGPFGVIHFWFESQVQARYSTLVSLAAFSLVSLYKVGLVFAGASVLFIASSTAVESVCTAIFLVYSYSKTTGQTPLNWTFSSSRAQVLLRQGGLIFLGSIFAMIYLKIDQVMLRWIVGVEEVGVYAVAARLSEVWYFVPAAIVASFYPRLIALHHEQPERFRERLQQVFDLLFVLALAVAILVSLVAEPIIRILFGPVYEASSTILSIHIWAAVFIFMRAALSKWILIENVLIFSLVTQGLGAIVNVALNSLLIPAYGGIGAAWATLFSYAVASYLALLWSSKTRPMFLMMSKAMFAPIRYPIILLRSLSNNTKI